MYIKLHARALARSQGTCRRRCFWRGGETGRRHLAARRAHIAFATGVGGDPRARFKLLLLPPSSLEDGGGDGLPCEGSFIPRPPPVRRRVGFVLSCTRVQ